MAGKYTVELKKVIAENALDIVYMPKRSEEIYISSHDVNRPGLIFAGFNDYFDPERVQFIGLSEKSYLDSLPEGERRKSVENFFSKRPVTVVFTRSIEPPEEMLLLAKKYAVPVLQTAETTSAAMSTMISFLGVELAERITRHGVFVEVAGEGVLILGDSGVGKSETAIELIKRGHRLIADDAVEIRRVSSKTLTGSAPDNIRHYIELRGIGIINARRIFGMGAVKMIEKIDFVIQLELWNQEKVYDRLGLDEEYVDIMGIRVPATVVPVKPGRNLAVIIEVAALNNRQKKMGYNAARELMKSLGMEEEMPEMEELEI
ncbi:MAG: HPr(Ser) kinase/phosphatase [Oscillospiraceae bacterium]|jgi:HPr kinase/phosphorylase|nr:HPr(Ser) kinase/phosphatase [Oscillospiraceae bacterium]